MNNKFIAKIEWKSKEQGGRQCLPIGNMYGPQIKIKSMPIVVNGSAWSLIVFNKEQISETETMAEVWYLSDEAPNNLKKDVEFELYEGNKLVAQGIIV